MIKNTQRVAKKKGILLSVQSFSKVQKSHTQPQVNQ